MFRVSSQQSAVQHLPGRQAGHQANLCTKSGTTGEPGKAHVGGVYMHGCAIRKADESGKEPSGPAGADERTRGSSREAVVGIGVRPLNMALVLTPLVLPRARMRERERSAEAKKKKKHRVSTTHTTPHQGRHHIHPSAPASAERVPHPPTAPPLPLHHSTGPCQLAKRRRATVYQ